MKKTKGNKINIIFSSFLIIAYIICSYFFSTMASQVSGMLGSVIQALVIVVFGLLLFYATRVGEGRQVRRFSLAVLLMVDLPALLIVLAGLIEGMPLHEALAPQTSVLGVLGAPSLIFALACVALGYGIPYTFFSGYEMKEDDEDETEVEGDEIPALEEAPLEGGLAEELAETAAEETAEAEAEAAPAEEMTEETTEETEE